MDGKENFLFIGTVKSEFENPSDLHFACEKGKNTKTVSKIIINSGFTKGLERIEEFSHLWVLYHLDRASGVEIVTHPGPAFMKNLPKAGIFATRSQYRPSKIALRLVKFIKRLENIFEKYETGENDDKELRYQINTLIKRVKDDIDRFHINTAISAMMEFVNFIYKRDEG